MAGLSGVINRLKVETIPGYRRSSRTSAPSAEAEARLKRRRKYRNEKYAYEKHGDSLLGMLIGIRDPDAMNKQTRSDRAAKQNNAGGQGEDINMPSLEQGKPGMVVAKPTVAAIVRQLNAIATVASQITSALQAHQAALQTRAAASREAAKENALEHRQDAVMENNVDSNNSSLTPIGTAIDKLNKAITSFVKILKKKEEEQNSDNLAEDIADAVGGGRRRRFRFGRGARGGFARFGLGLAGAGLTAATLSSMMPSPSETKPTGATLSRSGTPGPTGIDLNNLTPAPAPDKSTATDDISNAITPSVRSAGNLVEEQSGITQNDIAKMAGPLIATPFNKDNIKNIPISEATGSVDDALRNIIAGAPGKAGVDPSSGLIAPLSGIPALATSITGDIYRKIYNTNPDNDPLAAQRLAAIRKGVDSAFADTLRPFINFSPQANANATTPPPDATNVTTPPPPPPDASANQDGSSSPSVGTGATVSTQPTIPPKQSAPDAQQVRAPGATTDTAADSSSQTASDAQRVQAANDTSADTSAATGNQGDGSVMQASITTGGNLNAANDSGNSGGSNVSTAAPMPETKPTATSPMYASTGNILHDLFAWDKPYKTKAEKREQRESERLAALSNERERQARFGRAGILQSGISTTHVPNSVPSVKPAVPNGLVTSGVGDVPSPDFPFYEKYHTHLHFEGAMG